MLISEQIWPVRTTSVMRKAFSSVLDLGVDLFQLTDAGKPYEQVVHSSDVLRDQAGKIVAGIRQMKDSVNYEFGSDRENHIQLSEILLRATITAAALFWNQLAALHSDSYSEIVSDSELQQMRRKIARQLKEMATAVRSQAPIAIMQNDDLCSESLQGSPRCGDYVSNIVARYDELQAFVATLPRNAALAPQLNIERNAAQE